MAKEGGGDLQDDWEETSPETYQSGRRDECVRAISE
eukprot:CAMPEP_0177616400 /NCGR_PEP_ID=MMETSP0419_2-20121207/24127_1 /TAXON_ID=582737 /ORGANISM="Tetraselmis sp., Strain GSL018" /LENGTH=35 /DNA_ID= /DNA_START= /DNA_END= /DNA_ORIENTATION=